MNSILIIAHLPLAHALRQGALHVYPDCADQVEALDVLPHMPPEETLATARIMLEQMHRKPGNTGVLILTDLYGATPFNVSEKLSNGVWTRLVTGVNLPMLVSVLDRLSLPLLALSERAMNSGRNGIIQVAVTAPQNQARRNHDQNYHDHQQ